MTRLVNHPLLHDGSTADIVVDGAGVGMPASYLPSFHFHVSHRPAHAPQPITSRLQPLVTQAVCIDRGDCRVAIPMDPDQRDDLPQWSGGLPCPLFHRRERLEAIPLPPKPPPDTPVATPLPILIPPT